MSYGDKNLHNMRVETDPALDTLGIARYEMRGPIPRGGVGGAVLIIDGQVYEFVVKGKSSTTRVFVPTYALTPGTYVVQVGFEPPIVARADLQ